jgi:hypothetical protein
MARTVSVEQFRDLLEKTGQIQNIVLRGLVPISAFPHEYKALPLLPWDSRPLIDFRAEFHDGPLNNN